MFIDIANVVCTGQNAYVPITLKMMYRFVFFFAKDICNLSCKEISGCKLSNFPETGRVALYNETREDVFI